MKDGLEKAFSDIDVLDEVSLEDTFENVSQLIDAMFDTIDMSVENTMSNVKTILQEILEWLDLEVSKFAADVFWLLVDIITDTADIAELKFLDLLDTIEGCIMDLFDKIDYRVLVLTDKIMELASIAASIGNTPDISISGMMSRRTSSSSDNYSQSSGNANYNGGNTYNFYSPEPISEAVARREFEQLQRNLAFGF